MKKSRNGFIKNLRYLCLIGVIVLGLMTIVATGGSGGGGGDGEAYDRIKEINHKLEVLLSRGYSIDGQAEEILQRR